MITVDTPFEFDEINIAKAKEIISQYPQRRSAVMPLLYLVQDQIGFITEYSMHYVATFLEIPQIYVYEVASFYKMYHHEPQAKYIIQVCRTTPCWLCKSDNVVNALCKKLDINLGETTSDGLFVVREVECLGACKDAPVVVVNGTYYEKMDDKKCCDLIDEIYRSHN